MSTDPVPLSVCIQEAVAYIEATAVGHLSSVPTQRQSGKRRLPVIRRIRPEWDPWAYRRMRRRLLGVGRNACASCGEFSPRLQHDHVIPWSAGGCDHLHNLRLICPPCNSAKSNYSTDMLFRCEKDAIASLFCARQINPKLELTLAPV